MYKECPKRQVQIFIYPIFSSISTSRGWFHEWAMFKDEILQLNHQLCTVYNIDSKFQQAQCCPLGRTLNCTKWWGSSSGFLERVDHTIIAIIPTSTLTVTVIVIGNGHSDTSSNLEQGCLHFISRECPWESYA